MSSRVSSHRKYLCAAGVLLIWAAVTPFMWRDLRQRESASVRGPKALWWVASTNLTGSLAYWLIGRRPVD
jgi:hypothetical protein